MDEDEEVVILVPESDGREADTLHSLLTFDRDGWPLLDTIRRRGEGAFGDLIDNFGAVPDDLNKK